MPHDQVCPGFIVAVCVSAGCFFLVSDGPLDRAADCLCVPGDAEGAALPPSQGQDASGHQGMVMSTSGSTPHYKLSSNIHLLFFVVKHWRRALEVHTSKSHLQRMVTMKGPLWRSDVGQKIALHAWPFARNGVFLLSAFSVHSAFHFPCFSWCRVICVINSDLDQVCFILITNDLHS